MSRANKHGLTHQKLMDMPGIVMHTYSPSTQEIEVGGL
jgi:hypothetical protein